MEEKIISTENLYDGRVVKLDIHTVTLPNGNSAKREVVRHPGAVAIVAIDDDNQILFVRQFRLPAGKIVLEVPAGTLEPNELPIDCAMRELQEETGYRANQLEPMGGIYTAPGYTTEFIHLFIARDLEEAPLEPDADEFVEVDRIPLTKALEMIETGEIDDSKTVTCLLRVAFRQQNA